MNSISDRSDHPEDYDSKDAAICAKADHFADADDDIIDCDDPMCQPKQLDPVCCSETIRVFDNTAEHRRQLQEIMNTEKFKKIFGGLMYE